MEKYVQYLEGANEETLAKHIENVLGPTFGNYELLQRTGALKLPSKLLSEGSKALLERGEKVTDVIGRQARIGANKIGAYLKEQGKSALQNLQNRFRTTPTDEGDFEDVFNLYRPEESLYSSPDLDFGITNRSLGDLPIRIQDAGSFGDEDEFGRIGTRDSLAPMRDLMGQNQQRPRTTYRQGDASTEPETPSAPLTDVTEDSEPAIDDAITEGASVLDAIPFADIIGGILGITDLVSTIVGESEVPTPNPTGTTQLGLQ